MPYGLYISAEGALAQTKRLEVLANNLANVDTAGFKRDLAVFQAQAAAQTDGGSADPSQRSFERFGGGVEVTGTQTDFAPGPIRHTGIKTDMAINGEGFFVVRKENQDLLTRAGNFLLNGDGHLVTQDNNPVIDENGTPVVIDPDAGPFHITPQGGIEQSGATTMLALVKPASLGDLVKNGENLFRPLAPTQPVDASERNVRGEYLEQSAVHPTSEMMELMEASRAFEANVNMIRNQDQMLETLISRALKSV